jgi:surfeit locus 1 family protein
VSKFAPGWTMTVAVALLLPTVIALGYWQLARGAEKRAMEMDYLVQLTAIPSQPVDLTTSPRFQRVRLQGHFGDEAFLVDNQVLNGKAGYWLIQVFNDASKQRLLLNRGFIAGLMLRQELPQFEIPRGEVSLVGTIWPFTGLVPVLDDDLWAQGWPKRVQRLDVARMSELVDTVPVEIRLEPGQPGVGEAAPFAQVLGDAKHMGYAATWFGLAAALVAGYIAFGIKVAREKSGQ